MYKSLAVAALLLLFAVPAFPQQSNTVSVFVTDLAISNLDIDAVPQFVRKLI